MLSRPPMAQPSVSTRISEHRSSTSSGGGSARTLKMKSTIALSVASKVRPAVLLKGNHVRARQRYGSWFHWFVRQVGIARIQDIVETNGRLVAAGGRGRIHRNDHGVI